MLISMVTVMVVGSHINIACTDITGGGMVTLVEMMVILMLTLMLTVVEALVLMWVMWC